MEHVRFLLGQCLFSWMANAFFLTFWHNPNGPIKIHLASSPGSICQYTMSFGEWQAGFKFQTAENRLSIETGSCVSCFYFQKYLILLLSVALQLHREGWDSRKTALLLSFLRYQDGFSKEIEESLLLGIFWSKAFRLCYFWKFQFSLV